MNPGMSQEMAMMMARRGMPGGAAAGDMMARRGVTQMEAPVAVAAAGAVAATNEVSTLTLKCRAVNLAGVQSDASTTIIYALQNELRASTNFFDAEKTEALGTIVIDDSNGTFTFDVTIALKHPLKP